ncbi:hypothetical protein GSI_01503 [Ganoderma sinense ZZ0214-1]|uniref:Uncharacterized protein n=1 Tax=Ganoderma sinense ZZ0214-1 TaxID=1077348 RepID=A0A2G8SQ52_9APHY|nr:hypothetical protein GSI_01503 [Ganoderma sinense ZZ0214-1]
MRSPTPIPESDRLANAHQDWPELVETRSEAQAKTYEFRRARMVEDTEGAEDTEGINVEAACRRCASGLMTTVNTRFRRQVYLPSEMPAELPNDAQHVQHRVGNRFPAPPPNVTNEMLEDAVWL